MHRLLLALLLLLAIAVRLPSLDAGPLDAHHIRQADTSSMARVMARDGVSLWTPRIGWAGPEAGPVETEFPLYAATVGAVWSVLGSEPPWVPRTLSLLAWLLGGVALACLCKRRLPKLPLAVPLALYALSPLGVLFSRSIQPDALAVGLLVLAWERADASRAHERPTTPLLVSAGLLGVAIAAKGPVAMWLPVVAFAGWRGLERVPTRTAVVALALAVLPPAIWYTHAHQLAVDGASFKLWGVDSGKWSSIAALSQATLWGDALRGFASVGLTPLGMGLALAGAVAARRQREFVAPALGVLAAAAALVILLPAVASHEYYLLPMLPFASVLVGGGAGWLWREAGARGTLSARVVTAGLLMALAVSTAQRGVRYLGWGWTVDTRIAEVATAVRAVLPSGTATVVVDQHPQTLLYAIDQRGWHRGKVSGADVRQLRGWGAEALLVTDTSPTWRDPNFVRDLLADHPLVARGDGWTLVRLDVTH